MAGLRIVALWAVCALTFGCGGYYFVGFVSNPGGTSSITGVVTTVSDGFIADPRGGTQYTAVTFMNAENRVTINFCGDQQQLFPIDATVRADYTASILCSVLVRVVVDNESAK
ncbi:MAG TPA: hypothetical protein VGK96_13595 [Candidatus Sulfotelmatobacter sp.]